jgi:hypothetical protein
MLVGILLFLALAYGNGPSANLNLAQDQELIGVWRQFVSELKEGGLKEDKMRPYEEVRQMAPPALWLKWLSLMREKATWSEWEATPEIHQLGTTVHYLIPLTFDARKNTFCFTFLLEENHWYFRHMESITIRLDQISPPPVSKFPDVTEQKKVWIREERRMQAQIDLFNFLSKEKGKEYAFNWFKDGAGYFLEAKTWVPFVAPRKAFILYLCWEQSNLQGNSVTLLRLDDDAALVKLEPTYFKLYEQTSIQQKLNLEDYRRIFETQWQDRANSAGWNLEIHCQNAECTFSFTTP